MAEFNDRRGEGKVIHVQFGQNSSRTCRTCKGYGRLRGETRPHPDFPGASIMPTRRCPDCGGLGEV